MGEAKRRAEARKKQEEALEKVDIPRLAGAIRKLAIAASDKFGADCYVHAAIAQAVLARLGVEASLVVGYAAWRVGEGDSDIIMHAPAPNMVDQPGGVIYHVWLEIGDKILDLTTYQLAEKARQLDLLDGGCTTVNWCPEFLFVDRDSRSKLRDVIHLGTGLYYYEERPEVAKRIIAEAPELDLMDVGAAWLLYQNDTIQAFGPNMVK